MYSLLVRKYIVAIVFMSIVVLAFLPSSTDASSSNVDRISGKNRYQTAVEVSKKGWDGGADTVIVTAGDKFPDALTGTPLAFSLNAPILLTNKDYLPGETKNEITRLKAKNVIILGGENAVSSKVIQELEAMGISWERIKGSDRYETAAEIAERLPNKSNTAVVVYGKNFPDSLSVASYAARKGYPILLTDTNTLPARTKEVLANYQNTIVVGGEGVISKQVFSQLPGAKRYSGSDRYLTLSNVIKELNVTFGPNLYVATGESFADALTGSVLAAKQNTSLVLVGKNQIPSSVQQVLTTANTVSKTIIGGTSAVSTDVEKQLGFNVTALVNTAKDYMGVPYLWGGTTPSGFDCSGYLNYVFNKHGVTLPRTTADIWAKGVSVSTPEVGDIVFFETYKAGPSHAGIYIGNNEFIHASSTAGVTIHSMSNSYFYPRYLGAKRLH
ncbi:MAG: cell wall-binding repeat-containing protein [Bacillota bacterium]